MSGAVDAPGVQNPERDRLGAAWRQDDMAGEDIDELVGERGAVDRIGPRLDSPMIRIGVVSVSLAAAILAELPGNQLVQLGSCTFDDILDPQAARNVVPLPLRART